MSALLAELRALATAALDWLATHHAAAEFGMLGLAWLIVWRAVGPGWRR